MKTKRKNIFKSLLALTLALIMVLGVAPLSELAGVDWAGIFAPKAEALSPTHRVGDIVEFGSYPQSEVTDSSLVSALDGVSKTWVSYGYYNCKGIYNDDRDTKVQGDWMKYADFIYNGTKYRAVTFSQYRPYATWISYSKSHSPDWTYQDDNGYTPDNIYYFKYEPLKWRVLDPSTGLVLCESIIDSQAYHNTVWWQGGSTPCYNSRYGDAYANNYAASSIRAWLNDDFYNTAFSSSQKASILTSELDNKAYSASCSEYDSETTYDKVFLLSWSEMQNTAYGFPANTSSSSARQARGTDYAKCQGLAVDLSSKCSIQRLRSAGSTSDNACRVYSDGALNYGSWDVSYTCGGVRPALKISNLASGIFESKLEKLSKSEYAVFVTGSDGKPLSGAKVKWNSTEKLTDSDGMAAFNKNTVGEPRIVVSKDGYYTYDTKNTNYSKSSSGFDVFCLYKEGSQDAYKLRNAEYVGSALTQDILVGTKRLSLSTKEQSFRINCSANVPGSVSEYRLMQNDKTVARSTDGVFNSLKVKNFSKGGGITVKVTSTSGEEVETPLNLSFVDDKAVDSNSISLGNSLKLKLSSDIPYLGGSEISLSLPSLPVDVYVDDDGEGGSKIHVGLNANITNHKKKPDTGWTKQDKETIDSYIKDLKDTMKTLNDYSKGAKKYLSSGDKSKLKKVMNSQKKSNVPGLDGISIDFVGYGEGTFGKDGLTTVTVNLYIIADIKGYSMTQQMTVGVVPVVIKIDAGMNVKSAVVASYDYQKQTLSGDCALTLSPYLKAFGGVGIGSVVGVGAYGTATVDVEIQIIGTTAPTGLNKIDLTGELGIKAYLGTFVAEKPFAYKTYHLYTRTKKSPARAPAASNTNLYDAGSYTLQDVSYLSGESEWMPGRSSGRRKAAAKDASIKALLTQTYRNSQPQVVSSEKATVMAYIGADTSRDAANITRVMYSVYDKSSGAWSEPVQLDSNATADSMPYLYSDGKDIYIIYLDSAKIFSGNVTLKEYFSSQNLAAAKFDSASGRFASVQKIASSGEKCISAEPRITVNNGVLTAAWQLNGSDPFGQNNENSLVYSTFDGSSWSEPTEIASGLNTIVDIAVQGDNVYYICDADNDLNTADDRKLVKTTLGKDAQTIDSGILSSLKVTSDGILYWYSNGTFNKYDGTTVTSVINGQISGATGRFAVVGNKLMFLSATDAGSDIYVIEYDSALGSYTEPVKYTDQTKYIDTFSAASVDGEIMAVMTRRDVTITEENVDDKCELAYTVLTERHDVSVRAIDYDEDAVVPGASLPVTVEIRNDGTEYLKSVDINVTDSTGSVVKTTCAVSVAPGQTEEVTVNVPMKDRISIGTYTFTASETGVADADSSNNSNSIKIGYCKLDVSVTPIVLDSVHYIIITATNVSNVASGGSLKISNSTSPDNVKTVEFESLEPGESVIYRLEVNEELLSGRRNIVTVTAEADAEQHDLYSHTENIYCDLDEYTYVETNGITLAAPTSPIPVGGSYQLVAAAQPDGASLPDLVWASSDPSVASVDENGLVKALSVGTATISVTDTASNLSAEVEIDTVQVIDFGDGGTTIKVGEKLIYTPTIQEDYVDYHYRWSSSDPSVVTVEPNKGELTGIKEGTATITMTLVDDDGNIIASSDFTVTVEKKDGFFKILFRIITAPFRAIINLFKKLFGK